MINFLLINYFKSLDNLTEKEREDNFYNNY